MKIATFPIEYSYVGFDPLQPYSDLPLISPAAHKIGTLLEYKPGEFGLVIGFKIHGFTVRRIEDISFTALNKGQRIELEPVIICTKTNLAILKPKNATELKNFHEHAVKLAKNFEISDSEKITLYQKDLKSLKDAITTVKAKRFRFDNSFCFSLSQKIEPENGLSSPGPVLNQEGELIAYMIHPTDKYVISAFHVQYMVNQLVAGNPPLLSHYPLIDLELMDLTSQNYHLYLPEEAVDKDSASYGCSIQNCPTYPEYPLQRGDILIAVDGTRINHQHISHPTFGEISIAAAPLLTTADTLHFTLYRGGQKHQIEVEKSLFSFPNRYLQSNPKFAIMNGVLFQTTNRHLYSEIERQANTPQREFIKPTNNHGLGKNYGYLKEDGSERILITETFTNDTLFNSGGTPFNASTIQPFIVKKLNKKPIKNLETLIQLMNEIPVGTHYDLEGTMGDQVIQAYGIKIADTQNQAILASRAITRRFSENLHVVEPLELSEKSPSNSTDNLKAPVVLYRYESKKLLAPAPSLQSDFPREFSITTAATQGMLFIHTTTRHRSPTQPYQYGTDTKGIGSGFIIRYDDKNYIITCAHVLGFTTEAQLKANFPGQSKDFELNILMLNNHHDIAILQVHPELQEEFDKIAYPFYLEKSTVFPKIQSDILAIGFPGVSAGEKTNPKIQPGKVTTIGYVGNLQSFARSQNGLVIQVSAAISGGNSGGPFVDANTGAVLGIISNGAMVTSAQLSSFARPVELLGKMLKKLKQSDTFAYPTLPGFPFDLSSITDRKLKIAHGLEPDSLMGAKISRLYGNISGLEVGDILLELIDENNKDIYPVSGKGTISIEENDISYRAFFELREVGDPISIKVLRRGKEHLIQTNIDASWPISPQMCGIRQDANCIPFVKFCEKLILTNFDVGTTQAVASKYSLIHYAAKLQRQNRRTSTKVVILEILPNAHRELSPWITTRDQKELLFINKINGIPVHDIEDVKGIAADPDTQVFELECKSSRCDSNMQKIIFRVARDKLSSEKAKGEPEPAAPKSPKKIYAF
ncbi:MAG: hypothetical protein BGO43_03440 [Gammaproteobacteria bacterium 39-13]|nr:serine protease [Gammaproteobacteria bacterium]OJV92067.1 MAG: hypothetical protein BGO43_03440 [Gammaproteobacteria bacterium 39-13]